MNRRIRTRGFTWLFICLVLIGPLAAQHGLYVQESDGKFHAVFKVSERTPFIMGNGKLVPAKGQRLALKQVDEYLPVFVSIRDKESRPTNVTVSYSDTPNNNGLYFKAKFESADLLEDVFLVLDFDISNVGKKIFVFEVGRLDPRIVKSFSTEIALGQYMGSGQVDLHLFAGGSEVFTSEIPGARRDEILDHMIAHRISSVQQAGPKPYFGTAPAYPAGLSNTGIKGQAVVTLRISPQGRVFDPVVERATESAFGVEAVAAVKEWRFLPRVRDGHAVETKVSVPFEFDPPIAAVGGK